MRVLLATALLFVLQARGDFYSTPLGLEDMTDKQAVVQTSMGDFIIEFLPEVAPNHVGYFMKLAEEGAYDGTTFHRVILHGIIQGGDPITKDPDMRNRYGTGGLGVLRAEFNQEKHTRGAVSAVRLPVKNDSAGAQFFVCVVAGQLFGSTIIDQFGAFELAVKPINTIKLVGLGLVLIGAALVQNSGS